MAKIYAALILKGIKTIDDVPVGLRDEVQRILDRRVS
ncbi:MAG: CD1375 family protein [Flexilinea sp.]